MKKYFLLTIIILVASSIVKSQNIEVIITGIRSTQGQISIGIFKDDKSFQDEKPFMSKKIKKNEILKREIT